MNPTKRRINSDRDTPSASPMRSSCGSCRGKNSLILVQRNIFCVQHAKQSRNVHHFENVVCVAGLNPPLFGFNLVNLGFSKIGKSSEMIIYRSLLTTVKKNSIGGGGGGVL